LTHQQFLSLAYVKTSVQPQSAGGLLRDRPYDHLWRVSKVPGTGMQSHHANVLGGQYICVVPSWSLMLVATSEVVDATNDNTGPILIRHVFPAVRP
jgi:hypothetical protein